MQADSEMEQKGRERERVQLLDSTTQYNVDTRHKTASYVQVSLGGREALFGFDFQP